MPAPSSATTTTPLPPRRFRASDVVEHLDMQTLGEVCVSVKLDGLRSLMRSLLADASGTRAALRAALLQSEGDAAAFAQLHPLAHAAKGSAASLGLRSLQQLALQIEQQAAAGPAGFDAAARAQAATALEDTAATVAALLQRMGLD